MMLRYRQISELYHGVSKTKFMFLRLVDFGCSKRDVGVTHAPRENLVPLYAHPQVI